MNGNRYGLGVGTENKSKITLYAGWQVQQGLVWVWPESGPMAFIESAAAAPIVDPIRAQAQNWSPGFRNYVRDVPG